MKKRSLAGLGLWAGLVLFPAAGFSEVIQGEVAAVNAATGNVVIIRSDPTTGAAEAEGIQTVVSPATHLAGINSLFDLRAGDEVRAEVEALPDQVGWKVLSLSLDKVKIQDVKLPGEVEPAAAQSGF